MRFELTVPFRDRVKSPSPSTTLATGSCSGFLGKALVPQERIELPTFALRKRCSTAELLGHCDPGLIVGRPRAVKFWSPMRRSNPHRPLTRRLHHHQCFKGWCSREESNLGSGLTTGGDYHCLTRANLVCRLRIELTLSRVKSPPLSHSATGALVPTLGIEPRSFPYQGNVRTSGPCRQKQMVEKVGLEPTAASVQRMPAYPEPSPSERIVPIGGRTPRHLPG